MSDENSKRGAKGNFRGFKLAFLKLLTSEFVTWRAQGQSGGFYDYVVQKFFRKFGFTKEGSFSIEPLTDPEEPPDDGQDDKGTMTSGCKTQAEADLYRARFAELRLILSNWFRYQSKVVTSVVAPVQPATARIASTSTTLEIGPLAKLLGSGTKPPYRRSAFAHYQEVHFSERVSPEYKRRWALELKTYRELTPEQRLQPGILKPISVRTMTVTSAEMWKKELPVFRDGVQAEADAFHSAALKRYELLLGAPKTPLDYHNQLMTISQHLQPIAEAIAAQTGADVAIFLVGPIPSRQGQLEARSISATRPGASRSTRNWVSDDPEGVTYTEQRLVDHARGNFTNTECAMRALPLIPKGQDGELYEMAGLDEIPQEEDGVYDESESDSLTPAMEALAASAEEELRTIDTNVSVPVKSTATTATVATSLPTARSHQAVSPATLPIPLVPSTATHAGSTPVIILPGTTSLAPSTATHADSTPVVILPGATSLAPSTSTHAGSTPVVILPGTTSLAPSTATHAGSEAVVILPETTALAPSTTTHAGAAPISILPETTSLAPSMIIHTGSVPSDINLGIATPAATNFKQPRWLGLPGREWHPSLGSSTLRPALFTLPGREHASALLTSVIDAGDSEIDAGDSDEEEAPIVRPWHNTTPSSPIAAARSSGSPVTEVVIDATTTLQDLMKLVPLPPLGRSTSKPLSPVLPPTIHAPGFVPGRRSRPLKGIPPLIMKTLSVTTEESVPEPPPALIPASLLLHPSTAVHTTDLIPDYMRWPAWECKGFKWLISDAADWGDWQATIRMLMNYRQEAGFPTQKAFKFSSPSPSEVGEWAKTARRWFDADIEDVVTFGAQYRVWWQALQPTERCHCTSTTLPTPLNTMDWTGLRKPGINGLLLVAVALRWWGKATGADTSWRAAAQDFHLAMQCIYHESHAHMDDNVNEPVVVEQAPVNAHAVPAKSAAAKKYVPKSLASSSSETVTASGSLSTTIVSAYATCSKRALNTSSVANIPTTNTKRNVDPLPAPPAKRARRK